MRIRLVAVQGPAQLLNVIAVLMYQRGVEHHGECQDHLVIGGIVVPQEYRSAILEACRSIARGWAFRSISSLDEDRIHRDRKLDFARSVESVRQELKLTNVHCLYVSRNWQLFNELLLNAYPDSIKICYGDGFGSIDINGNFRTGAAHCPAGFRSVDEAYLFCPVQEDTAEKSFSLVSRLVTPPHHHLVAGIGHVSTFLPDLERYCRRLADARPETTALILTSNFTEASFFRNNRVLSFGRRLAAKGLSLASHGRLRLRPSLDPAREISMYLEQIAEYDLKGWRLLVKGHPRQALRQSTILTERLRNLGYDALEIVDFSTYPIELFACFMKVGMVAAFGSSSAASLSLVNPDARIEPLISRRIRKKYFRKSMLGLTGPKFSYYLRMTGSAEPQPD